jgi:hypothetical protein
MQNMHGYRDGDLDVGRFMSEYGPPWGALSRSTLPTFMSVADLSESAVWEFHTGDNAADRQYGGVQLDANLDFSDNYFDLPPGETHRLAWSSLYGNELVRDIGVNWWNHKKNGHCHHER